MNSWFIYCNSSLRFLNCQIVEYNKIEHWSWTWIFIIDNKIQWKHCLTYAVHWIKLIKSDSDSNVDSEEPKTSIKALKFCNRSFWQIIVKSAGSVCCIWEAWIQCISVRNLMIHLTLRALNSVLPYSTNTDNDLNQIVVAFISHITVTELEFNFNKLIIQKTGWWQIKILLPRLESLTLSSVWIKFEIVTVAGQRFFWTVW